MCRCYRRSWPRPTPSSWPVSSDPARPAAARRCSGGFSLAGLNVYSGAHGVDKNGRFGGGDRSRRLGRVRRDRSGRSRADTTTTRAGITIRAGTIRARSRSAAKTTIDADGTYVSARTSSPASTVRRAPSVTARATGSASMARSIVDNAHVQEIADRSDRGDRYGLHDERVPAVAADRRPRAGPGPW